MTHQPVTPDPPKMTCKTCGKDNIVNWDGNGNCITCTRNQILGHTNDALDDIILDLVHQGSNIRAGKTINADMFPQAQQAIQQWALDTFMELIDQSFTFLVPLELGNIVEVVEVEKLRKAAKEKLKP